MTSKIKVDNINKVSDDSNIIKKCGSTITLGASGDSIALASGASQTGFGRTGTVDWQTSSIKTATFTAANGEGYFANTSGGAFVMNLPAGSAGNIVSVVDYTNTFQTNSLTVTPNGSQKIGGVAASAGLSTEGQSVTFVYVDDTEGWKNVQDSTSGVTGFQGITATGGTITTSGNCKIHTFTGPGTFTVCSVAPCAANNVVSYMVVAGGGGGGGRHGGGGGAGGFREDKSPVTPYTASPLDGAGAITVTATGFPITVGSGGTAGNKAPNTGGTPGGVSTFSTITSAGGGNGHTYDANQAGTGGSGGGGGHPQNGWCNGAAGNTPPVSPPQGNAGGNKGGPASSGGGGGGATAAGVTANGCGGAGGAGATTSINGTPTAFGGGGGGGFYDTTGTTPQPGGTGGGGNGGGGPDGSPVASTAGTANTGGGGGGYGGTNPGNPSPRCTGSNGGSGIVIIRYKNS
jgi:hypothetical protein